ncbi:MAG: hypothetical protein NT070_12400 [Cyanobacteria bacterium]|nr:hypothetical protein [Cyanobacteriota bacterium]
MHTCIEIRCPNCGSLAQRLFSNRLTIGYKCPRLQVTQTECPTCDYFITTCSQNGAVLEAYAPGIQWTTAAQRTTAAATTRHRPSYLCHL